MKSNLLIGCNSVGTAPRAVRGGRGATALPKIAAVIVAFATFTANAADSLTLADFNHKIKLQVDGYTGTETLVNFPVLVRISESGIPGFHFADMSAWNNAHTTTYGHDLAFFAEDGTRLACEKDTWVHNGESLVWVKLPTMTRGTKFYMCYNVADGVYVTNDNPWGDYVGVWHLSESGINKTIADASPNGMDGYTTVGEGINANNGRIGRARASRSARISMRLSGCQLAQTRASGSGRTSLGDGRVIMVSPGALPSIMTIRTYQQRTTCVSFRVLPKYIRQPNR